MRAVLRTISSCTVVAVALATFALAAPARAQFRDQGVEANLGWMGLSTWDLLLNNGHAPRQNIGVQGGVPDHGWNLYDQPTFGLGYFRAIGYDLWWDNQAAVGVWTTVIDSTATPSPALTLAVSTGLRYDFLEERVRPFVAMHLQYLWLIGTTTPFEAPGNGFLGGTNMFIGLRPGGGIEWIFGDEQSLKAELDLVGYVVPDPRGLGSLFLPSSIARLSYLIYF